MEKVFNHNPNQTSVDWVIGEILKHQMTFYGESSIPLRIIEEGIAMHKKEIEKAWVGGKSCKNGEDYYNKTFR